MGINKEQLEINVNLHSLQPNFFNSELHYVVASGENAFRFATWNEEPEAHEQKFYCFLTEQELYIPAGDIHLEESYVLNEEPVYPIIADYKDFADTIEKVKNSGPAKGIRRFSTEDIEVIKSNLKQQYGSVEKHVVKSGQGQHLLLIFDSTEVSIAENMVYFRHKAPFSDSHYRDVKKENNTVDFSPGI